MAVDPRATAAAVALSAALAAVAGPARAAGPPPGPPDKTSIGTAAKPARMATKASPTHGWYDGAVRRELTLEPGWTADFTPSALTPSALAPAPVLRRTGGREATTAAFASPVLRDDAGRLRALPGGVLLVSREPLDDVRAEMLLRRAGAVGARRLGGSLWLLEGPPGLASLELANRLHDGGLFASAQPNWWVQRTTK
jgi:hypothetical protein